MKDLGSLDQQLRRGEVPDGWLPALEDVDPSTVLIIIWAGRLSRRVDAFYHEALRSYGLRYSDYAVLSLLRFSGAMSPKRLNVSLAITSGGLTKTIQRLESKQLVRREPDPNDGRGTLVSLTKQGKRTVMRVFSEDVQAHEELLRDVSSAGRRRIASALRDLLDAFEREA
ncbi:MAG: MarR family transcriptional regulator [Deltaproteobacteria bacterium]|jgi:DNA-binding MarR family transcriptional regulator|nr:MarR family transcriptional regulator [Deltaproteobacteria bacterium]